MSKCRECNGEGRIYYAGSYEHCDTCEGTGDYCDYCDNSGRTSEGDICDMCEYGAEYVL